MALNSSYAVGKAKAQVDIVPGLMPPAYVLGLMDAKSKKHPDKNKPGFDWVEDPTKKGGGYYRKIRKSSHAAVVGKVAAGVVLAGAGAAAIAAHRRNVGANPSQPPLVPDTSPAKRSGINKKVAVGAGVGALALAGAGATVASRTKSQTPTQPTTEARIKFEEVGDPWSKYPSAEQHRKEKTSSPHETSISVAPSAQLPPAKYQSRYPAENDPWEGKSGVKATISSSLASALSDPVNPHQLPPAKPIVYKRQLVPKTPKLRQQINLAKREQTGLEKAQENLEIGQYLQTKTHSPADVMRGVDTEMHAQERIANLKAKLPKHTPAGLATIRGKNRNSVRASETAQESRIRKRKEQESLKASKPIQEPPDNIPVTPTSKAFQTSPNAKNRVLETGQLPSRGEIVKAVGQSAVEKAKNFGQTIKERGLKKAVLQSAQNSRERRHKIKQLAANAGVDLPQAIDQIKSTAIAKTKKTVKQLAIEEGPPLVGSIIGGAIGGSVGGYPGYLAGDLIGTKIVRKAQLDIEATRKGQQKLLTNVNYRNASRFEKLKMLGAASAAELQTPEMKSKIAQKGKEDVVGWAVGNAMGKVGYNPAVAGSLAATTTKPVLVATAKAAQAVKNRGVVGATNYLLKSATTAPRRAASVIRAGNEREKEVRENIKKAILAAKTTRKTDSYALIEPTSVAMSAKRNRSEVLKSDDLMPEEFSSMEELQKAIQQLKDLIKETVEIHYDNIIIKDLFDFDMNQNSITAKFIGEDDHSYALVIDREGEPTLYCLSVPLPQFQDVLNGLSTSHAEDDLDTSKKYKKFELLD